MGLPSLVLSAVAIALGAILYWAIAYSGRGFRPSTVGVTLMATGGIRLLGVGGFLWRFARLDWLQGVRARPSGCFQAVELEAGP